MMKPIAGKSGKVDSFSVVIIDDDPNIIRLVTKCLGSSGCRLTGTLKPKEGFALVRKINPDVVLCDAEMDGMSGGQIIESLKSDPVTRLIPVVLMTGFAGPELFSHLQWTGFLSKPFTQSDLIAALHHAVASTSSVI
jgi:CheY-like chemotaxis protein